jgi:membrane protease YdiL (CAAX protease family)
VAILVGTLLFLLIVGLTSTGLRVLLQNHISATSRARTTLAITGSALGEIIVLLLLVLFLRSKGRSLRNLGLWRASPLHGWIVAAVVTALYLAATLMGALRGQALLGEVSIFHIYNALVAGITAGFIEEIFFRGWIITELCESGFGRFMQVLASGVLFGFAHIGWGLIGGKVHVAAFAGAFLSTSVLGILYALTYLASRRSLMPVVAGHVIMDVLIEPWLVLAALSGTIVSPH